MKVKRQKTKAYQIEPAGCHSRSYNFLDFKVAASMNKFPDYVGEYKYDGVRYEWQIKPNGAKHNFLTSRRVSVTTGEYCEKQDKPALRKFKEFDEFPADTIFDGEIVAKGGISCDAQSELVRGDVSYRVWDLVMYAGDDLRGEPLRYRRRMLKDVIATAPDFMQLAKQDRFPLRLLEQVEKEGGEGIIVKDPDAPYGKNWFKVKRQKHEDVVLWGYEETKSADWASKGWIGALLIGQWTPCKIFSTGRGVIAKDITTPMPGDHAMIKGKPHKFIDVGRMSGFDQALRADFSKNRDKYRGVAMEVEFDLRFPTGKFRSPRFNRFRPDKNHWQCIYVPESSGQR